MHRGRLPSRAQSIWDSVHGCPDLDHARIADLFWEGFGVVADCDGAFLAAIAREAFVRHTARKIAGRSEEGECEG